MLMHSCPIACLRIEPAQMATKNPYPYIKKFGLKIHKEPIAHVKAVDLNKVLKKEKIADRFHNYFGIQTMYIDGPYPWDVEDVFVRIFEKRLTGTQLIMD